MPDSPDHFRDFGILLNELTPPKETVRACLPLRHVIGQYLATCLIASGGGAMALLFGLFSPFPTNILGTSAMLALFGYIVFRAMHNDYIWVELDGEKIRAKHLYTRRVVERSIEEIEDLLTLVFQHRTLETIVTDAWLGRIRGIMVRFRDRRTPLQVSRTDPAMTNAKELVEAIVYRMQKSNEVDAEIINFNGKPLVRRIYWK